MRAPLLVAVTALIFGAICLPAAPAWADEVLLRNGFSLKGRVDDRGDQLVIHSVNGRVWVAKSQVKRIIKRETAGETYERRLAALLAGTPEDLDGRVRLAKWALAKGLRSAGRRQLRTVLALDPDHAGARTALGFVRHEGVWVTPDEQKRLLGFVRDDGEWVTREEADLRRAKRADARDAARAVAEIELAAAETRKREAQARIAEAQARRVESESARAGREWYSNVILHSGAYVARRYVVPARRVVHHRPRPIDPHTRAAQSAKNPRDPHTRAAQGAKNPHDPHTRARTGHRSLCDPHTKLVPSNYTTSRR